MSEVAPAPTNPQAPAAPITVSPGGGGPPPANPAPAGNQSGEWFSSFSEEDKGYVQNKGFKDPRSVVDSYRNLEKLMGTPDKLIKLPEKADDPAWGEVWDKLGRPKEAKDYNMGIDPNADQKFAEWARGVFHEIGLPRQMGEKLAGKWNEYVQGFSKSTQEAANAQRQKEGAELKAEWGQAYEQNLGKAKNAFKEFGFSDKEVDGLENAIGWKATMSLMHKLGTKIGEHNFVAGGGKGSNFGGVMTPEAARQKIASLSQDKEFYGRYLNGGAVEKDEMNRLHEMAYPTTPQT